MILCDRRENSASGKPATQYCFPAPPPALHWIKNIASCGNLCKLNASSAMYYKVVVFIVSFCWNQALEPWLEADYGVLRTEHQDDPTHASWTCSYHSTAALRSHGKDLVHITAPGRISRLEAVRPPERLLQICCRDQPAGLPSLPALCNDSKH